MCTRIHVFTCYYNIVELAMKLRMKLWNSHCYSWENLVSKANHNSIAVWSIRSRLVSGLLLPVVASTSELCNMAMQNSCTPESVTVSHSFVPELSSLTVERHDIATLTPWVNNSLLCPSSQRLCTIVLSPCVKDLFVTDPWQQFRFYVRTARHSAIIVRVQLRK